MKLFQTRELKEKQLKELEAESAKELDKLIEEFQNKHDVAVIPVVVFEGSVQGVKPITHNLKVISNKRFKK